MFSLHTEPGRYLVHKSELGTFQLSSDTISNSMRSHKSMTGLISMVPSEELDAFQSLGSTIGAKILFPGNQIGRNQTINVARGFNSQIVDRFDLSLECIRLHYIGLPSPLSATLQRYSEFFGLFQNFAGYLDFFLLNDFAENNRVHRFIAGRPDFDSPRPKSLEEYRDYMKNAMEFVAARNKRIAKLVPSESVAIFSNSASTFSRLTQA